MKRNLSAILIIILSIVFIAGCSKTPEQKIAGTWKVEDVKFESVKPVDQQQVEASKKSAQQVSYELLEDKTAKIRAGSTIMEGTWSYKAEEAGVYMSFKDSYQTSLLGKYEDGKLINIATRPDMTITTIFAKEK